MSSDFCHWGSRFQFTHQFPDEPVIHKSIARLDKQGMDLIEGQQFAPFTAYLSETENTICGRHPIQLLLSIIELAQRESGATLETKFVKYDQSEPVTSRRGSSVSYASSYTVIRQ